MTSFKMTPPPPHRFTKEDILQNVNAALFHTMKVNWGLELSPSSKIWFKKLFTYEFSWVKSNHFNRNPRNLKVCVRMKDF